MNITTTAEDYINDAIATILAIKGTLEALSLLLKTPAERAQCIEAMREIVAVSEQSMAQIAR